MRILKEKIVQKSNDQIEMEAEDEKNMEFDRCQTWKVDNENIKSDLLQALELSGKD